MKRSGRNKYKLASEVATEHPAARRYVNLLLGHYVKCDTIEQLRNYRTAITRECFVRRNFTDSHLNPQVYKRWFIGERAAPRQIEQREHRIDEIAGELKSLNKRETALRERLALTRAKIRPLVELETALPASTGSPRWNPNSPPSRRNSPPSILTLSNPSKPKWRNINVSAINYRRKF
jgi:hypothetical protein